MQHLLPACCHATHTTQQMYSTAPTSCLPSGITTHPLLGANLLC